MERQEQSLAFISYRRQDSSVASHWLGETIQAAFGSSSLFIDTDTIRMGDDWRERINKALRLASVLVAVIGPNWLRLTDEYGRRRLDKDDDWVRNEILHAINNKLLLIPLLISGASLPVKEALPDCLTPMLNYQAFELRDDHWERDRNVLLERLEATGFHRAAFGHLPAINMDERRRREALIFDQQLEILKTALSLVYRARNTARGLKESLSVKSQNHSQEPLQKLQSYHEAFEHLLYEERALLPDNLFKILHKLKTPMVAFVVSIDSWQRFQEKEQDKGSSRRIEHIDTLYQMLDHGYALLVDNVQTYIGVKNTTA